MSVHRRNPRRTALVILIALPFLYPFVFLIGTALKTRADFEASSTSLPSHLTLGNVRDAWVDAGLGSAMAHSLLVVTISVIATVAISAAGAFWFIRHESRGATFLRFGLIATMAVPLPVYIIPLFLQLSERALTDNLIVMGVVYAGWNSSFGLYLTHAYLKGLPAEVLEAAEIDGASMVQQLRHVIVPLSKPVLVTLAVFSFIWSWSDLLASVVLVQDPEKRLLIPATALLNDIHLNNVPRSAAAVLIAMVPMLFVFLAGQRALVRGILAGAGK
jgi:ABC-type glycerol-3-phosphate transport system permease component